MKKCSDHTVSGAASHLRMISRVNFTGNNLNNCCIPQVPHKHISYQHGLYKIQINLHNFFGSQL